MDVTPPFIEGSVISAYDDDDFEDNEAVIQTPGKDGKMKSIKQMANQRKATTVANKQSVKDAVQDGDDFLNEGINEKKKADQKVADNRQKTEAIKKGGSQGGW